MAIDIAVVIPCFNVAAFVDRTIDSVLDQSLPASEIIAVNDGSTDHTREVLARFEPRIRVVDQENSGLGAARNAGALAAQCEWLAFLDADNLYVPDALASFSRLHDTLAGPAVLFGDFQEFEASGRVLPPSASVYLRDIADIAQEIRGDCFLLRRPVETLVLRNGAFTPSCLVVRRDVFLRIGEFDNCREFQGAEDLDFYFRLLPTEDIGFLNRVVVRKHRHAANMSGNPRRMRAAAQHALGRAAQLYAREHRELLPILNQKYVGCLKAWAEFDLKSRDAEAWRTCVALVKRAPLALRHWWQLARALAMRAGRR